MIALLWMFAAVSYGQELKPNIERSWYVTALEDSALVLEAIKPIVNQQKVVIKNLTDKYAAATKEWMFKQTLLEMQVDESKKALAAEIKARRREKRVALVKGIVIGAALSVALGTTF